MVSFSPLLKLRKPILRHTVFLFWCQTISSYLSLSLLYTHTHTKSLCLTQTHTLACTHTHTLSLSPLSHEGDQTNDFFEGEGKVDGRNGVEANGPSIKNGSQTQKPT